MKRSSATSTTSGTAAEVEENEEEQDVWQEYVCRSLTIGKKHPGKMVESANTANVLLPPRTYPIEYSLGHQIEHGLLSNMQLEGIVYACERHSRRLPDGSRCGFFLGDAAGSGKGRQIAGIICDSLLRGRRKHIWFSASASLMEDAARDFRDLGFNVPLFASIDRLMSLPENKKDEGVLFCTYSEFIAKGRRVGNTMDRFGQLCSWLGEPSDMSGVIVFDECHSAKNYKESTAQEQQKGTVNTTSKTAEKVVKLQEDYPDARVVYASATGISSAENMGYMSRMGLWGKGTAFATFMDFLKAFKGAGAIEMLAIEDKAMGSQIARGVSYADAEFRQETIELTRDDFVMYRTLAELWYDVYNLMQEAENLCALTPRNMIRIGNPALKSGWYLTYWGAHQRHMRQLVTFIKAREHVIRGKAELEKGNCVVIGLQTTGETSLADDTDQELSGSMLAPAETEIISICRSILTTYVRNYFPTNRTWALADTDPPSYEYVPDKVELAMIMKRCIPDESSRFLVRRVLSYFRPPTNWGRFHSYNADGSIPVCIGKKKALLDRIQDTTCFPPAALDWLIDQFGGPSQVAEMTGRSLRQVRRLATGKITVERRSSSTDNNREQHSFMLGKKLVAIISRAASTGISLHAERNVLNQRRRVHMTLELAWAADLVIQQLGRSHRTNQTSAPIFYLLNSGLGGEHRFISAVAHKLQMLGALSHGDRRASAIALGDVSFESYYATKAVNTIYSLVQKKTDKNRKTIEHDLVTLKELNWRKIISESRFEEEVFDPANPNGWCQYHPVLEEIDANDAAEWDEFPKAERVLKMCVKQGCSDMTTSRFLNRILGLPISYQTFMFNVMNELMNLYIRDAKRAGKYDRGVQSFYGQLFTRRGEPEMLYRHPGTGCQLWCHPLLRDKSISFVEAEREFRYRNAIMENPHAKRDSFPLQKEEEITSTEGFYRSRNPLMGHHRVCLAIQQDENTMKIIRPHTGVFASSPMDRSQLVRIYYKVSNVKDLCKWWREAVELSRTECAHGPNCAYGDKCPAGKPECATYILTGNVFSLWNEISAVLNRASITSAKQNKLENEPSGTKKKEEDTTKRVNVVSIQVMPAGSTTTSTEQAERLVGVLINEPELVLLRDKITTRLTEQEIERRSYSVVIETTPPISYESIRHRKDLEYMRWVNNPFGPGEKMAVFGVDWDATGTVTQSRQHGVSVGSTLHKPNPTVISESDIKRRIIVKVAGASPTCKFSFLRSRSSAESVEHERFLREGLVAEQPAPVSKRAMARLLAVPLPFKTSSKKKKKVKRPRLEEEEEEDTEEEDEEWIDLT